MNRKLSRRELQEERNARLDQLAKLSAELLQALRNTRDAVVCLAALEELTGQTCRWRDMRDATTLVIARGDVVLNDWEN